MKRIFGTLVLFVLLILTVVALTKVDSTAASTNSPANAARVNYGTD